MAKMRSFPIDLEKVGIFRAVEVRPDLDDTGTQKKNSLGLPVWVVDVLHYSGDSRAEVERVKIAAEKEPTVVPLAKLRFIDLVARPWQMGSRSGVSLSASGLEMAGPVKGGDGDA